VPVITALNKSDLADPGSLDEVKRAIAHLAPHPVTISAKAGTGLDALKDAIASYLPRWSAAEITLPYTEEGISALSWLHEVAIVRDVDYESCGDGRCIRVALDAREAVLRQLSRRMAAAGGRDAMEVP
jgi:GTP-binding protein HflX